MCNQHCCFFLPIFEPDFDSHHDQFRMDAQFLCSDHRMDTDLVDKLVLQLNRIYPQILSDKEAHRVTTDNAWHGSNTHNILVSTVIVSLRWNLLNWSLNTCSVLLQHVSQCSSGTWAFPLKSVSPSCWPTWTRRARRLVMSFIEDFIFTLRTFMPVCPPESHKEVKTGYDYERKIA